MPLRCESKLKFIFIIPLTGKAKVNITGEHCAKVADVVDAMRKSYYEKKIVLLTDKTNLEKKG